MCSRRPAWRGLPPAPPSLCDVRVPQFILGFPSKHTHTPAHAHTSAHACIHSCTCIHTCPHMHERAHTCIHMHACTCACTYMPVHSHIHACTRSHTYHVPVHTCTHYARVHVCMLVHMCACMCAHVCVHVHTRTHTQHQKVAEGGLRSEEGALRHPTTRSACGPHSAPHPQRTHQTQEEVLFG